MWPIFDYFFVFIVAKLIRSSIRRKVTVWYSKSRIQTSRSQGRSQWGCPKDTEQPERDQREGEQGEENIKREERGRKKRREGNGKGKKNGEKKK